MNTIQDLRRALSEEATRFEPAPGLIARVLEQTRREEPALIPMRARWSIAWRAPRSTWWESPRFMALVAALLAIAIVASLVGVRLFAIPAPSPSGRGAVIVLHRNGPIVTGGNGALTATNPTTGTQSTLASVPAGDTVSDPAYSPDGRRLAYLLGAASARDGRGGGEIWTVDLKVGHPSRLTSCDCSRFTHISWSPDGSQLAFTDGQQIDLIDGDGAHKKQLTHMPAGRWAMQPSWSPDGTRIAFRSGSGIEVIRTDGTGTAVLLADSTASDPEWSPDGSRIAYVRDPKSTSAIDYGQFNFQLWLMDPDGSNRTQIFDSPGCCVSAYGGPAWSPDGTKIAVVAYPIPGWYLWVMDADGSHQINLGKVVGIDRPAWQPLP